jgi:hypothetical protein
MFFSGSLGFLSDTLRLFVTVDAIYLLHNQGRPLHGSGNHLVGSRTSLWPAEQIVCPVEIAGHDYPSNDADDPLAPFVHEGSLALSSFIRLQSLLQCSL